MRLLRVVYWLVVLVIVSFSDFQFAAVSIFLWMGCFFLILLYMQDEELSASRVDFKSWGETHNSQSQNDLPESRSA
jgi:hypothetical protein